MIAFYEDLETEYVGYVRSPRDAQREADAVYRYYQGSGHRVSMPQAEKIVDLLHEDGLSFDDADTWTLEDILAEVKG